MQTFDLTTQDFLKNHIGHIDRSLAIAIISQFGGEDALMHEYVMALPDSIKIENVAAFTDDKELTELYNKHKDAIIALGWKCAAKQGYKYPLDLYMDLKALSNFNQNQIVAGMHDEDDHLYVFISSEIFRFAVSQLTAAWAAYHKMNDDLGEQLFNAYHS